MELKESKECEVMSEVIVQSSLVKEEQPKVVIVIESSSSDEEEKFERILSWNWGTNIPLQMMKMKVGRKCPKRKQSLLNKDIRRKE